jgi:hypothetical protein
MDYRQRFSTPAAHTDVLYDAADSGLTEQFASGVKQAIRGRRDLPPPHTLAATGGISIDGRVKPAARPLPADARGLLSRSQDTPTQSLSTHASRRPASADPAMRSTDYPRSVSPAGLMSTFPLHFHTSSTEPRPSPTPLRRQKLAQQAATPLVMQAVPRNQFQGTPANRSTDASQRIQSYVAPQGVRSRLLSPPQRTTFARTPSASSLQSDNLNVSSASVRAQYLLEKPAVPETERPAPPPTRDTAALQTVRSLTNALLHGLTPLQSSVPPLQSSADASQQLDDAPPAADHQALTLFIAQAMEYASRLKMQLAESEEKNSQYERQLRSSPRGRAAGIPAAHRAGGSVQQLPSPTRSPRARSAPAWEFSLRSGTDARSPRSQHAVTTDTLPQEAWSTDQLPKPAGRHANLGAAIHSPATSPARRFFTRPAGHAAESATEGVAAGASEIAVDLPSAAQNGDAPSTATVVQRSHAQPNDAPSLLRGPPPGGVNAEGSRPFRDPDARRIRTGHGEQDPRAGRLQPSVRDESGVGMEQVRSQGRQQFVETMQDGGSGGTRESTAANRIHARLPATLIGSPPRQAAQSAPLPVSLTPPGPTLASFAPTAPRTAPGSPGIRGSLLLPPESTNSSETSEARVLRTESAQNELLAVANETGRVAGPVAEVAVAAADAPRAGVYSRSASATPVHAQPPQLPTRTAEQVCSKCKMLQHTFDASQSEKALLEARCSMLFTELSQVRSEFEQALSSNLQQRTLELDRESAMQMEVDMLRANVQSLQHSYQDVSALLEKRTHEAGEALLALAAERDDASSTAADCRDALQQLRKTVTNMQAELIHASERHESDTELIESLRTELRGAKEQAGVATHDRESTRGLIAKLQEDLRQAADCTNGLRHELHAALATHANLSEQAQEYTAQRDEEAGRNTDLQRMVEALQISLSETLRERDQLRERLHEANSAKTEEAGKAQEFSIQVEAARVTVANQQREFAQTIKQMDEQMQQLQTEARIAESSLESTERLLLEARASAQAEQSQLQATVQGLQQELGNARSQTEDHASKLQEATDTLLMMMQQIELLQAQSAGASTDVQQLQLENESSKHSLAMAQESCNEWQRREMTCRAELQRADESLNVTTEDRNSLFDRMKELEGLVALLRMEKHATDAAMQDLMLAMTASENKAKLYQDDAQRLALSEQQLRERLNAETIRSRSHQVQAELHSTQSAFRSEARMQELQGENAELRAQLDTARETLAQLTDMAASLSQNERSQSQFPHQHLTDIKNEVERLQGDLQRSLSQVAMLASERDSLAAKVQLLEAAPAEYPVHSSIRAAAQVLPSSPIELAPSINVPSMNAATPQRGHAYDSSKKTPSSILKDAGDVNRFFDIALAGNLPPDEITWLLEHASAPGADAHVADANPRTDTRSRIDALPTSQLIAGLRVFMGGDVPNIPASDLRELALALGDDFLNAVSKLSGSRNKPPVYPRR